MMRRRLPLLALLAPLAMPSAIRAQEGTPGTARPKAVADILASHDQALMADLVAYLGAHPDAPDADQAYLTLFERAIQNDWFERAEPTALAYLKAHPEGAVRPLAQIVATMARAQAGGFDEALASYRALMGGLGQPDQEEFAVNFADTLAGSATTSGRVDVARGVYTTLLERFGSSPTLRQKVEADLARLDLVGKPAPAVVARDLDGMPLRLADLRGKFVLVDFWATWCAPCVAELPNLRAAYDRYHARGLEVVAVSLDEAPRDVSDFARARKIPWRQVHHASCETDLVAAFGVNTIPATFLIGPDGTILRLDLRGPALTRVLAEMIDDRNAEVR